MKQTCTVQRCPRSLRVPLVAVALTVGIMVTACGSDSLGQPPAAGATAATSSEPTAAGDVTVGESAGVRFVSTRFHYRVDAPGTVTEAADGTATASRGVEQLTIRIVSGSAASDPSAYARSDTAALPAATSSYTVVNPLATVALASHPAVGKIVYTSSGTNPVTGNAESLVNARYYIARNSSMLAVVTYSIVLSQYDPQGADDVVTTFAWQ
jgi:hypothetical protein